MQETTSGLALSQVLSKKQANLSDAQTNGYFCFNLFHFCVFVSCNFHLYKLLKPYDGAINPLRPLNFFGMPKCLQSLTLFSSLLQRPPVPVCVWGGSARLTCSRRPRRGGEARATEEAVAAAVAAAEEERATRGRFPLIPLLPSCLQFHNCRFPWSGRQ